jgi:hypothetical protein
MIAYTSTGIPFTADPDDGPHVACECGRTSEGGCLFCGTEVCEDHGRFAEGEGWSCAECVVETQTESGDVIYVSRRELEKERASVEAAEQNDREAA